MADLFPMVEGDLEPGISLTLLDFTGAAVDLTVADSVKLRFADANGVELWLRDITIDDAVNGVVFYDWQAGDTDTPGYYLAEVVVTWTGSPVRPQTYPASGRIYVLVRAKL